MEARELKGIRNAIKDAKEPLIMPGLLGTLEASRTIRAREGQEEGQDDQGTLKQLGGPP